MRVLISKKDSQQLVSYRIKTKLTIKELMKLIDEKQHSKFVEDYQDQVSLIATGGDIYE